MPACDGRGWSGHPTTPHGAGLSLEKSQIQEPGQSGQSEGGIDKSWSLKARYGYTYTQAGESGGKRKRTQDMQNSDAQACVGPTRVVPALVTQPRGRTVPFPSYT